jgi:hypothetical protein
MKTRAVFVSRKDWWAVLARILEAVEGCSHVGVFHPMSDGSYMVSDMTGGGFRIRPASEWLKHYKIIADLSIEIPHLQDNYLNSLLLVDDIAYKFSPTIYKTKYSRGQLFWDALEILTQWFGANEWKKTVNGKRRQVCSEWVARYFDAYGLWKSDKYFDMVTLKDCFRSLKEVAYKVEGDL